MSQARATAVVDCATACLDNPGLNGCPQLGSAIVSARVTTHTPPNLLSATFAGVLQALAFAAAGFVLGAAYGASLAQPGGPPIEQFANVVAPMLVFGMLSAVAAMACGSLISSLIALARAARAAPIATTLVGAPLLGGFGWVVAAVATSPVGVIVAGAAPIAKLFFLAVGATATSAAVLLTAAVVVGARHLAS